MRAATVIVGAIAAASILIALAFIVSGGSSGQSTPTKTVVVESLPSEESAHEEPAPGEAGPQFGGPDKCGKEYAVENVSCGLGAAVHSKYEGGSRQFQVKDPESGGYLEFRCGEPTPVICDETEGSGSVSFG
jgi:hypothetical protein